MKNSFVVFSFLFSLSVAAQSPIATHVYPWRGDGKSMFDGSGAVLSKQTLVGYTLKAGKKMSFNAGIDGAEQFFIIKYGPVKVQLNDSENLLDKGSVVFLLPGDAVVFTNPRKDPVEIYAMSMSSSAPDVVRGKSAGASFVMNWFDMTYKAHDKGGVRQLFDRKTVMNNRFDIHITSLNPGLNSHAPHTHKNEEIILMIDGEGEMVLGNVKEKIVTGEAAWVESNIPHNITNTGKRPAVYFAIQWN
jgi:(S)-ureidoglycine aminohydrolase